MRFLFVLLAVYSLVSCENADTNEQHLTDRQTANEIEKTKEIDTEGLGDPNKNDQFLSIEFKSSTQYNLQDTIVADFNGDEKFDQAIYIKTNKTSGIKIIDGASQSTLKIGFGHLFAHIADFDWVEYWGLVNDTQSYEIIFDEEEVADARDVVLEHPSIVLRQTDAFGGIITFRNGQYDWIHQAD